MRYSIIFICSCIIALCYSCNDKNAQTINTRSELFHKAETLDGRHVEFDTIPGVVGLLTPVDSLYFCYLYDSEHYIMITDRDFNILGYTARKGGGPGEVIQISTLFGNILKNTDFAVLDPNKRTVYGCDLNHWNDMTPRLELATVTDVPTPLYLQELKNGKYLMAPMDYQYGLYTYDQAVDSVYHWPIGPDLPENKKHYISSGRRFAYNQTNDIVAEYYSVLPLLILHNVNGDVVRIFQYDDMPRWENIDGDSENLISGICLTDNCIFTLLGDCDSTGDPKDIQSVLVTDYEGHPVVRLNIKPAYSISIDKDYRRLIAVNPDEDENITIYDIPDWIVL